MSSSSDSGSDSEQHNGRQEEPPAPRRTRGATKMAVLAKRHYNEQERVHIEFDANMNPMGPEEDHFISYLGFLGRSKVRIIYDSWRQVPKKTKAMIWQQILVHNFRYILCI